MRRKQSARRFVAEWPIAALDTAVIESLKVNAREQQVLFPVTLWTNKR